MQEHLMSCRCGQVALALSAPAEPLTIACHCKDCRAYAHWLGATERVLDAHGGTTIRPTTTDRVRIARGAERLAAMSLSPRGTLRWYASCCRSPVANMSRNWRFPFIGCVRADGGQGTRGEGPPPAERIRHIMTEGIEANLPKLGIGDQLAMGLFALRMGWVRLSGGYRRNPFFDATRGEPLRAPHVLDKAERETLDAAVRAAAGRYAAAASS